MLISTPKWAFPALVLPLFLFPGKRLCAEGNIETVLVSFLAWDSHPPKDIFIRLPQKEKHYLGLHDLQKTPPVSVPVNQTVKFYRDSTPPGKDGERKPILEFIPDPEKQINLAILNFSKYNREDPPSILLIDDSWEDFPAGNVRFFNISKRDVTISLMNNNYTIAAGDFETIQLSGSNKGNEPMIFTAQTDSGKKVYTSRSLPFDSKLRILVFLDFVERRTTGFFKFKAVPERVSDELSGSDVIVTK